MRAQKVGGGLLFLMGLVLLLCIIAFALGTMAQGEEALETLWIIFIGLPLVAVFFQPHGRSGPAVGSARC
jgi:hypothetical protein